MENGEASVGYYASERSNYIQSIVELFFQVVNWTEKDVKGIWLDCMHFLIYIYRYANQFTRKNDQ